MYVRPVRAQSNPSTLRSAKWAEGAYSDRPSIEVSDGGFTGRAAIESWKGNVGELLVPARALVAAFGQDGADRVDVAITWADNTRERLMNVDDLERRLAESTFPEFLAATVKCVAEDRSGSYLVKNSIPGITIQATAIDREWVAATTSVAYQKMMIGYVDRLGRWRAPLWMALPITPAFALQAIDARTDSAPSPVLPIVALALGILVFIVSYPRLLISTTVEIVESTRSDSRWSRLTAKLARIWRARLTRILLGTLWVIFLGFATNKISDAIHWP